MFISPFMALWDHAVLELHVAQALEGSRFIVEYLACDGIFQSMCVAMSGYGLREDSAAAEKLKVCEVCRSNREKLRSGTGRTLAVLENFIGPEDMGRAERLTASQDELTFLNFVFLGIPVGKLCTYEYMLHAKKNNSLFTPEDWSKIRIHFKNCLLMLMGLEKRSVTNQEHYVFLYNSLYSVNAVATHFFKQRGTKVYFLHHGLNLAERNRSFIVGEDSTVDFLKRINQSWDIDSPPKMGEESFERVTNHLLEITTGRSVFAYSAGQSDGEPGENTIARILKIPEGKKVIVASMSSGDERIAAEFTGWVPAYPRLFDRQVDWVRFLAEWVQLRPDVYLIFRVHPREFPNKRENILSEHARELQEVFKYLPPNAVVNWPEQNISLYELAEEADVFLNAWSSVGKEMALLGLPVVIYSKDLVWYPENINYLGETKETYVLAIEKAIRAGWDPRHSLNAYHWFHQELILSHFMLKNKIFIPNKDGNLLRKLIHRLSPDWAKSFDLWNLDTEELSPKISSMLLDHLKTPLEFTQKDPVHGEFIPEQRSAGFTKGKSEPFNRNTPADFGEDLFELKNQYRRLLKALYPESRRCGRRSGGLYENITRFLKENPTHE